MKIKKKAAPPPSRRPAPAPAPAADLPAEARQYRSVDAVLRPELIPFQVWKEWFRARDRNDWFFMYDMTAPGSQAREVLGDRESFPEAARRRLRPLPGLYDLHLDRVRLDSPDIVQLIHSVGGDDPALRDYHVERWVLLRDAAGWRIHRIDMRRVSRDISPSRLAISMFSEFRPPAGFRGYSTLTREEVAPRSAALPMGQLFATSTAAEAGEFAAADAGPELAIGDASSTDETP